MKKILSASLLALSAVMAGAAPLDKGGVTFDFKKISDGLFKPAAVEQTENLVTNADGAKKDDPKDPLRWQPTYCFLHTNALSAKDPRHARTRKTVKWESKEGVFTVTKPEELKSFIPPKILRSTSGGWRKPINLPHDKGGLYNITFQYKGQLTSPGGTYLLVSGWSEVAGKWWKGKQLYFKVFPFRLTGEYQNYQNALMLPAGIKSIELVPRIDGTGFLSFRNMAVTPGKAPKSSEKLTLQLSPMSRLDGTFALAQDLPITATFIWKKNCAPAELKLKKPALVVLLPREIKVHDVATLKYLGKKETASTRVVPPQERKPFDELMLRIKVDSCEDDNVRVRVNVPLTIIKVALECCVSPSIIGFSGNAASALNNIDFAKIIQLAENGMIGKILEVDSGEGTTVEIVVE